jgi:hypothetical protein
VVGWDARPSWTPDGRILFNSSRECPVPDYNCMDVYVMDREGGGVERVLDCPCDFDGDAVPDGFLDARMSPDGKKLTITNKADGTPPDAIFTLDLTTGETTKPVTDVWWGAAEWQPLCTVEGTSGADVLTGTAGRDLICGLGEDDRIRGRGGNDVIFGHGGNDRIVGGPGRDILVGGEARNNCRRDRQDFIVRCG